MELVLYTHQFNQNVSPSETTKQAPANLYMGCPSLFIFLYDMVFGSVFAHDYADEKKLFTSSVLIYVMIFDWTRSLKEIERLLKFVV